MSLKLYYEPDFKSVYGDDSPFTVTFNGLTGGAIDKKVYIRNDDRYRYYDNISVSVLDSHSPGRVDGSLSLYSWKLAKGDFPLALEEWNLISAGAVLALTDSLGSSARGDISSFIPLWIRVSVPSKIPIQTIKDITVTISATEHYIPNG